jgi:hypothetical protein
VNTFIVDGVELVDIFILLSTYIVLGVQASSDKTPWCD